MSTNTSEQGFSMDIGNQLQDMIKALDMMDDEANQVVQSALLEGAEIIAKEQRRLIVGKSPTLAGLIKAGRIYVTKGKGRYTISVGYDTEAIRAHPEAVIMEFGKPGKKSGGVDKLGRKIGKVESINHIRKGFDNKNDEAAEHTIDMLNGVLKKW